VRAKTKPAPQRDGSQNPRYHPCCLALSRDRSLRAPTCPHQDNGRCTRRSLLPPMEHRYSCLCGRGSARGSRGIFADHAPIRFHRTGLAGGAGDGYSSPSQPVPSTVARSPVPRNTDGVVNTPLPVAHPWLGKHGHRGRSPDRRPSGKPQLLNPSRTERKLERPPLAIPLTWSQCCS